MATRAVVRSSDAASGPGGEVAIFTWSGLANLDDGDPVAMSAYSDRSVQVTGTFGVGGNCRIQGSNDGVNWAVLTDPQGNDLNITSAKIEAVLEVTRLIRPLITAGDGTTNLAVTMLCRRNR